MGPPKDTSPPFLFGKDLQPNLQVNEDTHPNSSINEDDNDDISPQNIMLSSKLFDNPPIPVREEERPTDNLQSSLLTVTLPQTAARAIDEVLDQRSNSRPEDGEENFKFPSLEEKASVQIQDDTESKEATHAFPIDNPVNGGLPVQEKALENQQIPNDATSNEDTISQENLNTHKEASSPNSQSSMSDSKGFDNFAEKHLSKIQDETRSKEALQTVTFENSADRSSRLQEKVFENQEIANDATSNILESQEFENLGTHKEASTSNSESSSPGTKGFDNFADKTIGNQTLQSSFTGSNIEKPLIIQNSDTNTIYSNYEEREEQCFFDRAKFIAICGEDFFDQSQEPWPQDVKLYQPYEMEQVILPDNANCLAVQAYLKMCGLDFQIEQRHNAEYMSPSGRVPFIKCGAFVVSELDPIIAFINTKGVTLTGQLDAGQRADMRAYMSLANTVLANAELYVAWVDPTTANAVTRPRYGSVHPWPLNHIVTWQKGRQVRKRLAVLGWLQKSLQEVYAEVENCCNALSERLDKKDFFFGSRPTELDALVFGHLFTVLTTPLPSNRLASIVRGYPALVELVKRIEKQFFQRED